MLSTWLPYVQNTIPCSQLKKIRNIYRGNMKYLDQKVTEIIVNKNTQSHDSVSENIEDIRNKCFK
jgi:hypothetical protein